MTRVLITEAHDGLGLALVKEYLTDPNNQVVAFCGDETKCDQLNMLKESTSDTQLLIVPVNLADEESIKASVKPIEGFVDALDLLIFNTGFIPEEFFCDNFLDLPDEVFFSFIGKIARSPSWLRDHIFHILKKGDQAKCIGMSLYMEKPEHSPVHLVNKASPMMTSRQLFGSFTDKIDPTIVSAIHLSDLWSEGILDNDTLDAMNNYEVFGQDAINKKAKALYKNIPKITSRKHYYMRKWHTGTYS